MPYFYVYVTENTKTGEFYIGSRVSDKDPLTCPDGYLGSGKNIDAAIKELGRNSFQKTILEVCNSIKEAREIERELIKGNLGNKLCYNMVPNCSIGMYGLTKEVLNNREMKPKSESVFALMCKIRMVKNSLERDELEKLHKSLDYKRLKILLDLGYLFEIRPCRGYYPSKDFICSESTIEQTPSVGTIVGENWKIVHAWVTDRGYIKGYKLKCTVCGREREFIGVREARKGGGKSCDH